jgi:alkylation response protein AidB-like acyl-CoA dehydrogenase
MIKEVSMDFSLSEEQKMLRSTIRDLFKREFPRQYIRELDKKGEYPLDIYHRLGEMGLLGLPFPEKYGGSGGDYMDFIVLLEALCKESMLAGSVYLFNVGFGGTTLLRWGTEEQKNFYLPKLIKGEMKFALCFTEPNAGSDLASITTSAVPVEGGYKVNGSKTFSTGAHMADRVFILTRTDKSVSKHKGLSLLIADTKAAGIEIHPFEVLGVRGCGENDVYFSDLFIPADQVIGGKLNQGWEILNSILTIERLSLSAQCVGNMQAILDDALDYAKQRVQFGQPIGKFQAIQHMLAEMYVDLEAARLLAYRVAWLLNTGQPYQAEASAAKVFASEAFVSLANKGMQVMGGAGYTMDQDMQRYLRDARMFPIGGGTTQIQKNIIAKSLGL